MATERRRSETTKVVVVDDDIHIHAVVARLLEREGFVVHCFDRPSAVLKALAGDHADAAVLLTDLEMPEMDGIGLLREVRERMPRLPVIFMTGQGTVKSAVEAMRLGAYDFMLKPLQPPDILVAAVRRALEYRQLQAHNRALADKLSLSERFHTIVGSSRPLREMFSMVESVADVDVTVLILGESGTGKELIARAIHERSNRSGKRFVAVNCGALTESVLESELFGHVQGAFTGADRAHRGLFEEAAGSTLFLDEVGELPLATQVKLLRVLQEGEIRPVGASESRRVDVRVLAATHQSLEDAIAASRFREDLYYRLNVFSIEVPPLRSRSEDIPQLAHHFIAKHAAQMGRPVPALEREALDLLVAHSWPGNVRELENAIARALVLAREGVIAASHLPAALRQARPSATPEAASMGQDLTGKPLAEARAAFDTIYLDQIMDRAAGNIAEAARLAGVDPSNLRRTLKRYDLDPETYRR